MKNNKKPPTWGVLINYHLLCHAHIYQSLKLFLHRQLFCFHSWLWSAWCCSLYILLILFWVKVSIDSKHTAEMKPQCAEIWVICWVGTFRSTTQTSATNADELTDRVWQSAIAVDWCEGRKETVCLWALWVSADNRINNKKGWVNIILQAWAGGYLRLNDTFYVLRRFF